MRAALAVLALAASGLAMFAQSPPQRFEVATVKLASPDARDGGFRVEPGGRMVVKGFTLQRLIMTAWRVQGFRVVGYPGWGATVQYDIEAKAATAITEFQGRLLLRELLKDRFQLALHSEQRPMTYYALTQTKSGAKLSATPSGACTLTEAMFPPALSADQPPYCLVRERVVRTPAGTYEFEFRGRGITMTELARVVGVIGDRVGLDETGLTGGYDVQFRYADPERGNGIQLNGGAITMDSTPTIFTALEEQLGLKLESRRGPIEVFVVDKAERPSEN